MILYGWYTTELSSKRPKEIECFSCGQKGQMFVRSHATIFMLYIHMFPIKMWQELECVHCHAQIRFREMGPELKTKYKAYRKFPIPRPWHFTGPILILGLLLWSNRSKSLAKDELISRAKNIKVDRIIDFKITTSAYSTMKVCAIDQNEIKVVNNIYQVERKKALPQIQLSENYDQDTLIIDRDTLLKWIETDKVSDIYW